MNTAASPCFDPMLLGQPTPSLAPFTLPAKTARQSTASQTPGLSASLWHHTAHECEAARRHGVVVRSLLALLGALSLASVAPATWQLHALLSGHRLHDAISSFLR